jgi:hypothetical protein
VRIDLQHVPPERRPAPEPLDHDDLDGPKMRDSS